MEAACGRLNPWAAPGHPWPARHRCIRAPWPLRSRPSLACAAPVHPCTMAAPGRLNPVTGPTLRCAHIGCADAGGASTEFEMVIRRHTSVWPCIVMRHPCRIPPRHPTPGTRHPAPDPACPSPHPRAGNPGNRGGLGLQKTAACRYTVRPDQWRPGIPGRRRILQQQLSSEENGRHETDR